MKTDKQLNTISDVIVISTIREVLVQNLNKGRLKNRLNKLSEYFNGVPKLSAYEKLIIAEKVDDFRIIMGWDSTQDLLCLISFCALLAEKNKLSKALQILIDIFVFAEELEEIPKNINDEGRAAFEVWEELEICEKMYMQR